MFTQYLEKHDIRALVGGQPECPFARMGEREKWDAVQPQEREAIEALWRELHAKPYPMVLATDFLAFVRNGSRTQFEDPYFFRRTKLVVSVLHMCVTGTADALDDVINGIWCILEESSWVISAHNVNPHPLAPPAYKKPLPDPDDGYIDLFAAQTAGILAAASHMLRDELDAVAPVIRRRISREIERRIFAPFMTRDDMWWMGFIRKDLVETFLQGMDKVKCPPDHALYESARFKEFLPQMYALWKNHPDPYQNVHFDLRVKQNPDGTWSHICDNLPPHLKNKG